MRTGLGGLEDASNKAEPDDRTFWLIDTDARQHKAKDRALSSLSSLSSHDIAFSRHCLLTTLPSHDIAFSRYFTFSIKTSKFSAAYSNKKPQNGLRTRRRNIATIPANPSPNHLLY